MKFKFEKSEFKLTKTPNPNWLTNVWYCAFTAADTANTGTMFLWINLSLKFATVIPSVANDFGFLVAVMITIFLVPVLHPGVFDLLSATSYNDLITGKSPQSCVNPATFNASGIQ
jgi:DNA topoisomerase IB